VRTRLLLCRLCGTRGCTPSIRDAAHWTNSTNATDATWYRGFFDRLGIRTRITETGGAGKALANLKQELSEGRPAIVWCSRLALPFFDSTSDACGLWMHSFVVNAINEATAVAYGGDCAATKVSLTLEELAAARAGICSHKQRTLTFDAPKSVSKKTLRQAVRDGLGACLGELSKPKMKTFSFDGFELWAKMLTNDKNQNGWRKVFARQLLYCALRDVFDSIETSGNGGGLFRRLFADFLDEVAPITKRPALAEVAGRYRDLADGWTALADLALFPKQLQQVVQRN